MTPAMNTNAYLLTRAHIEALNEAGLYAMQISIDNLEPGDYTMNIDAAIDGLSTQGGRPAAHSAAAAPTTNKPAGN